MKKALANAYLETPPADGDKCTYQTFNANNLMKNQ